MGKIPGLPVEPGQYVQFDIFQGLQLGAFDMDASIELDVLEVAAYASIIDNKTQDPIFIRNMPSARSSETQDGGRKAPVFHHGDTEAQ